MAHLDGPERHDSVHQFPVASKVSTRSWGVPAARYVGNESIAEYVVINLTYGAGIFGIVGGICDVAGITAASLTSPSVLAAGVGAGLAAATEIVVRRFKHGIAKQA